MEMIPSSAFLVSILRMLPGSRPSHFSTNTIGTPYLCLGSLRMSMRRDRAKAGSMNFVQTNSSDRLAMATTP